MTLAGERVFLLLYKKLAGNSKKILLAVFPDTGKILKRLLYLFSRVYNSTLQHEMAAAEEKPKTKDGV